jgi:phosphotriesterase-related protein
MGRALVAVGLGSPPVVVSCSLHCEAAATPVRKATPMPTTEIPTVRGPLATSEMGTTLSHEHVFVLTPDSQANWPGEWDEDERVADAVVRLRELRDSGVQTIVDPTVDGLGRYVPRLQRINAEVEDLNIVVATGLYTYTDVPNFFAHRGPGALPDLPEPMVDLFVSDIREGIQGTDVRAAFLKCAIDEHGLTGGVERILRAVGAAHVETGVPVMVHTHPGTQTGLEVKRVLAEEGVAADRVQLAHSGDSTDADHLSSLADDGFLLGMDRFGIDLALDFDSRVGIVAEMCRRGYASSMVLSQDASCYIDWIQPDLMPLMPNWHYLHVRADVVPALLERGVTEDQVELMLVDNPRRWFEGA